MQESMPELFLEEDDPVFIMWLADTPGVHLPHRMQHLLDPAAVRQLLPKGPLKAFLPPTPQQLATQSQADSNSSTRCALSPCAASVAIACVPRSPNRELVVGDACTK